MNLYLDTSVVVPYYCEEESSKKVQLELRSVKKNLFISSLTFVEIHSALARKIRKNELTQSEAKAISGSFETHFKDGHYKKIPLQKRHYLQAESWLKQFNINSNLRTLDALQLSAAAHADLAIFTLDKKLAEAANLFNVKCKFLSEQD